MPIASQADCADAPQLGPFELAKPTKLTAFKSEQVFSSYEALNGSFSSAESCANNPNGIWVVAAGRGECIRYYPKGFTETDNSGVLVYFGGDVMLHNARGVRFITGAYARQSPATIEQVTEVWSREAGKPAIFVARPGIYGSSGDHDLRRFPREIELMDRALDEIKARHNVTSFILSGHSGGGQIVAGLLNRRTDISAAVITSGLVSVKQVSAYWKRRTRLPDRIRHKTRYFYAPVAEIGHIPPGSPPQIVVISDPEDRIVPFSSQLHYVRRLRAAGLQPQHIYAHATDRQRHVLAHHGRRAAALIARGQPLVEIRRAVHEMDLEQFR